MPAPQAFAWTRGKPPPIIQKGMDERAAVVTGGLGLPRRHPKGLLRLAYRFRGR